MISDTLDRFSSFFGYLEIILNNFGRDFKFTDTSFCVTPNSIYTQVTSSFYFLLLINFFV